ncbi:hypothetical protein PCCS19_01020 [Paenibacillus sp. CCS19]|uniref:hypothetical protein n=1 Tax=Paenibacillus sp. CCS19 TaxID=3158387 RepID=UPI0025639FBE|nr:hypothetical protein [Paenibacillus cellulosilyticus]GMK37049.1 hypothetical protein PCCS19_01020 [Paenibacillus cellulosilyticus]
MNEDIFLSDFNPISKRWVIFEDDGQTGWLYLTEANDQKPQFDCWIYNRIQPPNEIEISKYRTSPPPVTVEYAGENAFVTSVEGIEFKFKWSKDGNSVALLINEKPVGYIIAGNKRGFSSNLKKDGPWGSLLKQEQFEIIFQ